MQLIATFPDLLVSTGKPLVFADTFQFHYEAWSVCRKFCQSVRQDLGLNPTVINDESYYRDESQYGDQEGVVFVSIQLLGVNGGKGGFGAQLRSLAKQKGAKRTTDFGACRDLSGRRLRNVNHEIILSKWMEAKEKGETFDVEQDTSTGIELWFMSAPNWADGVKADKRKKFLKSRYKNTICSDWMRARETATPPKGAPAFWGCPRGRKCEFAHGEQELRGAGKERLLAIQHDEQHSEKSKQRDDYLLPLEKATKNDEEVTDMISEGLQVAKRSRRNEMKSLSVGSSSRENVEVLSGTMIAERHADGIILTGCSSFSTCIFQSFPCATEGQFFFEVELLTNGLMQIGWCDSCFEGGNEETGDGVGDDCHSWAFDGFRQKFIHDGQESSYVVGSEDNVWEAGDIVSCCLYIEESEENDDFLNVYIAFALQGLFPSLTAVKKICRKRDEACFYPSVSCESSESVVVNIRQKPFAFHHLVSDLKSMYSDSVKSDNKSIIADLELPLLPDVDFAEATVDIDWASIVSASDLTKFSGDTLKKELIKRSLKFGGTVEQKADRLFKAVYDGSDR